MGKDNKKMINKTLLLDNYHIEYPPDDCSVEDLEIYLKKLFLFYMNLNTVYYQKKDKKKEG